MASVTSASGKRTSSLHKRNCCPSQSLPLAFLKALYTYQKRRIKSTLFHHKRKKSTSHHPEFMVQYVKLEQLENRVKQGSLYPSTAGVTTRLLKWKISTTLIRLPLHRHSSPLLQNPCRVHGPTCSIRANRKSSRGAGGLVAPLI